MEFFSEKVRPTLRANKENGVRIELSDRPRISHIPGNGEIQNTIENKGAKRANVRVAGGCITNALRSWPADGTGASVSLLFSAY